MLAANGQPTAGGEASITQRCSDGMLYGALAACTTCGGALSLARDGTAYRCGGDFSEFTKCEFRTQTPRRTPWVVPSQLRSNAFLAKFTPKVRTKLFPLTKPPAATPTAGGAAAGATVGGALPPPTKSLQTAI